VILSSLRVSFKINVADVDFHNYQLRKENFSINTIPSRKLTINRAPIITVIGKAYFDVGHAPKDQSNRRMYQPEYAAWEIHPVMKVDVR
jgi:hypothetical protein